MPIEPRQEMPSQVRAEAKTYALSMLQDRNVLRAVRSLKRTSARIAPISESFTRWAGSYAADLSWMTKAEDLRWCVRLPERRLRRSLPTTKPQRPAFSSAWCDAGTRYSTSWQAYVRLAQRRRSTDALSSPCSTPSSAATPRACPPHTRKASRSTRQKAFPMAAIVVAQTCRATAKNFARPGIASSLMSCAVSILRSLSTATRWWRCGATGPKIPRPATVSTSPPLIGSHMFHFDTAALLRFLEHNAERPASQAPEGVR